MNETKTQSTTIKNHAWRASWNRPVKIDESKEHPFTIARMTDHNVKGRD